VVKIVPVEIGDIVVLKKGHSCGANEWEVTKLGMDIGLRCLKCGRNIRLIRSKFDTRFKDYIKRAKSEDKE